MSICEPLTKEEGKRDSAERCCRRQERWGRSEGQKQRRPSGPWGRKCGSLHKWSLPLLLSLQSCPTLCDPIDGSPPGSPVPENLQARTLEWVAISFSNAWKWKVKVKSLSHVWLFATPWTAAFQAPPSMGFYRQDWSGLPLPSPKWSLTSVQKSAKKSNHRKLNLAKNLNKHRNKFSPKVSRMAFSLFLAQESLSRGVSWALLYADLWPPLLWTHRFVANKFVIICYYSSSKAPCVTLLSLITLVSISNPT